MGTNGTDPPPPPSFFRTSQTRRRYYFPYTEAAAAESFFQFLCPITPSSPFPSLFSFSRINKTPTLRRRRRLIYIFVGKGRTVPDSNLRPPCLMRLFIGKKRDKARCIKNFSICVKKGYFCPRQQSRWWPPCAEYTLFFRPPEYFLPHPPPLAYTLHYPPCASKCIVVASSSHPSTL